MMTEQIQKKKPKKPEIKATVNKSYKDAETMFKTVDKTVLAIDEKYLEEFKEVKETTKSIIIRWARELKEKIGMHPNNISAHITNCVKKDGFCNPRWVRRCLSEEFKNPSMAENANAGGPRPASTKEDTPCPHCHLKPKENPKDDAEIIWEMPPEKFDKNDLVDYNRNYLIEIVRYLLAEQAKMKQTIKRLEDELKA